MRTLRVWAPHAEKVEANIRETRAAMKKLPGGWWEAQTPRAEHGADYAFILDGEKPLPDPRSAWQPSGVHGPSRVFDHRKFAWSDGGWQPPPLSSGIIYELHVGTFSPEGTFDGVARRLDYLADLGITHIELMPVNTFPGTRGWGYEGVDLYAPLEQYGGPDGLKRLVNTCHNRGFAVILDVVYNHFGPEGNYLEKFGPYFTDRYSSLWGKAVNFDGPDSDEVRRFFCDNALMWLRDYHMDGLRIDAIHAIVDTSAVHILEQLAIEVDALEAEVGRHLTLIAESDLNDPRVIKPREIGGYGIHAAWSDDFHHALHTVLTGEKSGYYLDFGSLEDLSRALTRAFVYDGRYSPYRRRVHGRPIGDLSGHRFLGYIQNHDQVGNRAGGERLSQMVSPGRLKIAAAVVFTSPFVPMVFQGEEWGASTPFQFFADHGDAGLREAVRKGRCEEFAPFDWKPENVPDPYAIETFEDSRLNWEEMDREPHHSILEWYRALIRVRRSMPVLTDGRLDRVVVAFDEEARWISIERGPVTVVCNLAGVEQGIMLARDADRSILLASEEHVDLDESRVRLPRESVAILGSPRARPEPD